MGNNTNEDDKSSKIRELLKDGCIAAFYTQNGWFVKIKPVLSIDKIKFSFVEKGKKGEGFDVYMDINVFDNLCDEIRNGVLLRKIESDQGDYPSAWKYVTGNEGSKEIIIGKGKKGTVIQGKDNSKKKNAFVAILNFDEFKTMEKWYRRATKNYFEEMTNILLNAVAESDKYYQEKSQSGSKNSQSNTKTSQSGSENTQSNNYANTSTNTNTNETPQQKASSNDNASTPALTKIEALTTTLLTPFGTKGNLCIKAVDIKNREFTFVVNPTDVNGDIEKFKSQTGSSTKIKVVIGYINIKDKNYVKEISFN